MASTLLSRGRIGSASINAILKLLAPLASPAFTGNPTAPTQASGNSSTRLATTAFVADALAGGLPLQLKTYTVAELPAAAAGNTNQLVHVSDGSAGAPCIALSTGAAWKVVATLGADVAAA